MRAGADSGGTFTDVVAEDGTIAKVPSTPDDPARALRSGLAAVTGGGAGPQANWQQDRLEFQPPLLPDRPGSAGIGVLAHGTTVATNALLERRGAPVALVTNHGFADVVEIARQHRPSLYDPAARRPPPLVPRGRRYQVVGRLGARGEELEAVDLSSLGAIDPGVAAVAVCLLHADLDPRHEQAVAAELARRGLDDVTCSHQVAPEFREYERTSTTVLNAYLRPACRDYLRRLAGAAGTVLVMTSAGGLMPAAEAAELPAALVLSGPAGGVGAAAEVAQACGWPDAVSFDMGGTSTDVCLVQGGAPAPAAQREVAGFPVRLPSLDIHTIGAGGGSLARLDAGGALVVGPESAGAVPGPACYGRGGTAPTVTDADLVLGRIPAGAALPGLGVLDRRAAAAALAGAGVDAAGVVAVVDAGMERALRQVSVARGVDPRGLALVAFGGAGPLHACALAEALDMPAVIVPARAGVLSAVGLLGAPLAHDAVASWPGLADHRGLDEALAALADAARAAVSGGSGSLSHHDPPQLEVATALDCRYAGQSHELTVATVADFAGEHRRRNGYDRPGAAVEVVALRARARVASPVTGADLPAPPGRRAVTGPAVVAEDDCTIWVPEGWRGEPGPLGALVLTREQR
ncbi:MAG TPA: hydantoinase/oxoprolinase family protein [Acidimicrobiales bacterium]|nr:hydantoinase/oxoprolinase family protein [Acidimicrobiales bacterium]